MKAWQCAAFAAVVGSLAQTAQPTQAQRVTRVGAFQVRMQTDPATGNESGISADVVPQGGGRSGGLIVWTCASAGLAIAIELDSGAADGDTRRVVWRFDGGRADSAWLQRGAGTMWRVREDQAAQFTQRARSAGRLVMEVPGTRASRERTYAYDLAGAAEALDLLCRPRRPPAPPQPPRPGVATEVRETPPDEGTYELSAVEVLPRARNGAEVARLLARGYPPELREAGVTGSVTLRFRVLENGRVDSATVQVTRSTHEAFNEPAMHAVRQYIMTPARVNNRPVRVWVEQPIGFMLTPADPDSTPAPPRPVP